MNQVIGIDWDHTVYDIATNALLDGVREAFDEFRMRGFKILIHSCNNPKWIRMKIDEFELHVDYVWGETGMEAGKPVCVAYIDDRAVHFGGDWNVTAAEALHLAESRAIKSYRGPVYRGNPRREAELKHRSRECPNGLLGCENCGPTDT